MLIHKTVLFLSCISFLSVYAQQTPPFVLTEFPIVTLSEESEVTVKWTGASSDPQIMLQPVSERYPDSATLYFSTDRGGGDIANYSDSITAFVSETLTVNDSEIVRVYNSYPEANTPPERKIVFKPANQQNMGPGVYYYMVARRTTIAGRDTVFYSNELKMIVESDDATILKAPDVEEDVPNLTPVFSWEDNPEVPYYHIILSDEKISADLDNLSIEGLSIVWQAITPNTQITYGAPDPSGTLTADPPPMSPGQSYSWVVLNNYGNHPAYTSSRVGLPRNFTIVGDSLKSPVSVSPADSDTINAADQNAQRVEFAWTNLDSNANTYKLYIYVAQEYQGLEAQMAVWENEYTAGTFESDTARVNINLKNILTNNSYSWKVMAVDSKGAGKSGNTSRFVYRGIPTGFIEVKTREKISASGTTVEKEVAAAKIEVEVLEGSMEAPLLFYTDTHGNLTRERPSGTYRITAVKDGFESASRTVTVMENDTSEIVLHLQRPDATIYGKALDETGNPINLAYVYGVSERGDTVRAETDAQGNFAMSCYQADWSIRATKTGYVGTTPKEITVQYGQNVNFGRIVMTRNRYILSGLVQNGAGDPLIGAKVQLVRNGMVLDNIPSTSQEGTFSFSIEPGEYTLIAEKTGFVSYRRSIDIVGSKQLTITMSAGAALLKGNIIGRARGVTQDRHAPITNATVLLVDTTVNPPESIQTVSDAFYGDFSVSIPGDKQYVMISRASGYVTKQRQTLVTTESGRTHEISDTLLGLARIRGSARISGTTTPLSDVAVGFVDTLTRQMHGNGRSDGSGLFEIGGLADGVYQISAGKEGFMVDSVFMVDTSGQHIRNAYLTIVEGLPTVNADGQLHLVQELIVSMIAGEKSIAWYVDDGSDAAIDASIKLQSPLQKNLRAGDTLQGMGPGSFFMTVDADDPHFVDLSSHHFHIGTDEENTQLTDTITMLVTHIREDSMRVDNGRVELRLNSRAQLSEAVLFYKDHTEQVYDSLICDSLVQNDQGYEYLFTPAPRRNGSVMEYYFRAKNGDDVYGYEQEVYRTYIHPDTALLTRIVVEPSGDDTLILSSDAEVTFTIKGYYGSRFIEDENLNGSAVSWSLSASSDCELSSRSGLQTRLQTGENASDVFYLVATIDTTVKGVDSNIDNPVRIPVKVTGRQLESIAVRRVDSENDFITTGPFARAEFTARGKDNNGDNVTISPLWSVWPENAGTISGGTFIPDDRFTGRVQVTARVNNVRGVYNQIDDNEINNSGLLVRYAISLEGETVTNGRGCTVSLPDSLIQLPAQGKLQIEMPMLDNRVMRNTGEYNLIGDAYDITEITGAPFTIGTDSIVITLDIPDGYREDAGSGKGAFVIGRWNNDSLRWDILPSSRISDDGSVAWVYTSHFSRYAILHKIDELKGILGVKPNPFSPYIRPSGEYGTVYGNNVPLGVCFEVTPVAQAEPLTVGIDVYSINGAHILTSKLPNPERDKTYHIWWDGKTIGNDRVPVKSIGDGRYRLRGKEMCRNGRYFVVVTIEDGAGNEKQYMKPVVLFK